MIIGMGSDIVDIRRIEKALTRHGERFEARCFSHTEQTRANNTKRLDQKAEIYAKRFAAKEACAKALGCGIRDGIYLKDIAIDNKANGQPILKLTGGAESYLKSLIPMGFQANIHVSLSDEPPYAFAHVIIEAVPCAHPIECGAH